MQPGGFFSLHMEGGPEAGRQFPLAGPQVTIGRQVGNTIVIEDERLSRRHARIDLGPGGPTITDLGSANGTRVNGQPAAAAQPLRPGDLLDLGGVTLRVAGGATLPATAVAAAPIPAPPSAPGYGVAPPPAPRAASSSGRLLLIIGGVLAVLLVCGCTGVFGVLALANRDSTSAGSSGGGTSGGSGGSGSSGGASGGGASGGSSTKRQAGFVNGIVVDAQGKGVPDAVIDIAGTTIAGERTLINVTTDRAGRYSRRVPDGLYSVTGRAVTTYNGKEYQFLLDPDDGSFKKTLDSQQGIVKDFHWKLTGLQPTGREGVWTDYYGAVISVSNAIGAEGLDTNDKQSMIEFTLTPRGPLVDGSTSPGYTQKFPLSEIYSAKYLFDIPHGAYTATARLIGPQGAQSALQLAPDTGRPYAASLDIDFAPSTSHGTGIVYLRLKK